ncbi:MAG TPA: ABC transporter ATP-binding protein [Dehalococcoidia bacterium]|nr:ABC transporter ATP-binding protein [Dehalococcoidia bacterium]
MKQQRSEGEAKTSRLRTIWFFLRNYKGRLFMLLGLAIIAGYLETLLMAVLFPILQATLDQPSYLSGNPFFIVLSHIAGIIPVDSVLVANSIVFIILTLLVFLVMLVYINLSARTTAKVSTDYKKKVFQKYTQFDYQFFVDNRQGDLLYKAKGAPESIATILMAMTTSLAAIVLLISVLALLFSLSWKATIGVLLGGIAYSYFTRYLSVKVSYVAGKGMLLASQDENVVLNEYITGAKQIITTGTFSRWQQRFNEAVMTRWRFWVKNAVWTAIPTRVLDMLMYLSIAIFIIVVWWVWPYSFASLLPLIGTFGYAAFRLLPRVSGLGSQIMGIMNALPNLEVTYELLEDKTYSKIINGTRGFSGLRSGIELRNVSFTHKNKESVTVSDISLRVDKDKVTAIVGPSGAGKSTIVDLFLRLYDVDNGVILIDGVDIKDYELSSLQSAVGFVGQETFIYNASVKDNIEFGTEYDLDKIMEATQVAGAHEFIQQLDAGYDTVVGDRGVRLSGGERQRIAIARAMIRRPQILVLDEATSALDNISERVVQKAIDKVSESCTTLVVAHRLSTIRNADAIYVLDGGRVVESGTHDQLLNKKGKYWELYSRQEEEI